MKKAVAIALAVAGAVLAFVIVLTQIETIKDWLYQHKMRKY